MARRRAGPVIPRDFSPISRGMLRSGRAPPQIAEAFDRYKRSARVTGFQKNIVLPTAPMRDKAIGTWSHAAGVAGARKSVYESRVHNAVGRSLVLQGMAAGYSNANPLSWGLRIGSKFMRWRAGKNMAKAGRQMARQTLAAEAAGRRARGATSSAKAGVELSTATQRLAEAEVNRIGATFLVQMPGTIERVHRTIGAATRNEQAVMNSYREALRDMDTRIADPATPPAERAELVRQRRAMPQPQDLHAMLENFRNRVSALEEEFMKERTSMKRRGEIAAKINEMRVNAERVLWIMNGPAGLPAERNARMVELVTRLTV